MGAEVKVQRGGAVGYGAMGWPGALPATPDCQSPPAPPLPRLPRGVGASLHSGCGGRTNPQLLQESDPSECGAGARGQKAAAVDAGRSVVGSLGHVLQGVRLWDCGAPDLEVGALW